MVTTGYQGYEKAVQFFVKSGFCPRDHHGSAFNGISKQDLDIARRNILDSLGALIVLEHHRFQHRYGLSEQHAACSKLFYSAVRDVCSSYLEREDNEEGISESLLCDMISCANRDEATKSSDWMAECWAVTVYSRSIEENNHRGLLEFLRKRSGLPIGLKTQRGGTMMHLGAACSNFVVDIMDAISSSSAAQIKDNHGRLPLHWAAAWSCSAKMLDYLLVLNPDATRNHDGCGMMPIALVVNRAPFPEQVEMVKHLVHADPRSCRAIVQNSTSRNLLHIFASAASRYGERNGLEVLFEALLELVPRGCLLAGDIDHALPLHLLCNLGTKTPVGIMSMMIHASPEAVGYRENMKRLPLQCALQYSSADVIKVLFDATYTEDNVDLFEILSSKALQGCRNPDIIANMVQTHTAKFPDSVRVSQSAATGELALHCACYRGGHVEVVKLLYKKYPDAITHFSRSGRLPLHLAIEHYDDAILSTSLLSNYADVIRFLVRSCPRTANMKKSFSDGDWPGIGQRMTQTPIALSRYRSLPVFVQRLLLCACPEADRKQWRNLNYRARREVMLLAFAAISRQIGPGSMVWQLRRLMHVDRSMSLLKHVVSFI